MWIFSKIVYSDVNDALKFIFPVVKGMHSDRSRSGALCGALDLNFNKLHVSDKGATTGKKEICYISEILHEFCSILVKFYKNVHFTAFHSLLKENFEEKLYVLLLYLIENGKVIDPSRYRYSRLAWLYIHKRS